MEQLPVELARLIMRHATATDHWDTIVFDGPLDSKCAERRRVDARQMDSSRRTKLALVGVSRAWRYIANEFLYEHLEVDPCRDLTSLVNALSKSDATGRLNASYTRRLDLFDIYRWDDDHEPADDGFPVIALLRLCDHLSILRVLGLWEVREKGVDSIITTLAQTCPHSLRKLEFHPQIEPMAMMQRLRLSSLQELSQRCPRLESIKVWMRDVPVIPQEPVFHLHHLSALDVFLGNTSILGNHGISKFLLELAQVDLPDLRHFIVEGDRRACPAQVGLAEFLARHASSLQTLHLQPNMHPSDILTIFEAAVNVREVMFSASETLPPPTNIAGPHPHLERLIIALSFPVLLDMVFWDNLLTDVRRKDVFPSLHTICLVNEGRYGPEDERQWTEFRNTCAALNIQITNMQECLDS
ncbi:hypothetical protein SISSUDRAFT_1127117 [Sistotremastrum suecicum HHB10207 ss-3]|uniref:F-box domain-containing protein n=1 Tax=Sistotremastrum suecicum HHB10207 ss-3 TaxID=1314776 RepID=A0A166FI31_9AGAM|nr:hypothetical protein SISSUDRAFT_1127117 [Sistotremastrum suecicum HHB10207 ss-3]